MLPRLVSLPLLLVCRLVRLAHAGLIHGDFNEFNLMIHADECALKPQPPLPAP